MTELASGPIAICGTGAIARSFGRVLAHTQEKLFIVSRDVDRAQEAAMYVGGSAEPSTYGNLPPNLGHILIAVTEQAIRSVAESLAASISVRVALHTSGTFDVEVLAPLQSGGAACGSIHPLQTLSKRNADAAALRGVAFAVSGDEPAVTWAHEIARRAHGEVIPIAKDLKPLYHAAAVLASNYVTALIGASETVLSHAGIAEEDARRILRPLVQTTVENALTDGPAAALTGPIIRGDQNTVRSHLRALTRLPTVDRLYRAAGLQTLELAKTRGLDDFSVDSLCSLLSER